MPISLGRVGFVSIASGWMYSKSSRRPLPSGVWRLEHGDVGVVAVEADGGVGPLSADRVTAEDGQPEVGKEGDRRFEVADGDADVLEFDGHRCTLPSRGELFSAVSWFWLSWARNHSAESASRQSGTAPRRKAVRSGLA
jgi:hypothetical protein